MPKITNSNGDLSKAFFGTAEVEKIFLGSTELYSKAAPVSYVIPAGIYYGKDDPDILDAFFALGFTSNGTRFYGISFGVENVGIDYYTSGSWSQAYYTSWNSSYRTINVLQDTTVTQAQYEAFFGCFGGYGGTIQCHSFGSIYEYVRIGSAPTQSVYDLLIRDESTIYFNVPSGVDIYITANYGINSVDFINHATYAHVSGNTYSLTPTADDWAFEYYNGD